MKHFTLLLLICATILSRGSAAEPVALASGSVESSSTAAGESYAPLLSRTGDKVMFLSYANNLVTNGNRLPYLNLFLSDMSRSNVVLLSVSNGGVGGADIDVGASAISADGRFVAFASGAGNLVSGDTNQSSDIFLRDVEAGTTRLISISTAGRAASHPASSFGIKALSDRPLISADGRYVYFESWATNLTADTVEASVQNIYGRDTWSNDTFLVSTDMQGSSSVNRRTELLSITTDGRYVVFGAQTNYFNQYRNTRNDQLFVRDTFVRKTYDLSSNVAVFAGIYFQSIKAAEISGDGRRLAIQVETDRMFILRHDLNFNQTVLITNLPSPSGHMLSMSEDGKRIAFASAAGSYAWDEDWNAVRAVGTNLNHRALLSRSGSHIVAVQPMPIDTNRWQIVRHDMTTGTEELVTFGKSGAPSGGNYYTASLAISYDGSRVVFTGNAADLVEGDRNNGEDVFLRRFSEGRTHLVSMAHPHLPSWAKPETATLTESSLSADGKLIAFTQVSAPTNRAFRGLDLVVRDPYSGAKQVLFHGGGKTGFISRPMISESGNTIAATWVTAGQPQGLVGP